MATVTLIMPLEAKIVNNPSNNRSNSRIENRGDNGETSGVTAATEEQQQSDIELIMER